MDQYTVVWELADGVTQESREFLGPYARVEAVEFLAAQLDRINGDFNWIQIEPLKEEEV